MTGTPLDTPPPSDEPDSRGMSDQEHRSDADRSEPSSAARSNISSGSRHALAITTGHLVLVACLGQHYAKQRIFLGAFELYPTEIVAVCVALLGARAIAAVPWDPLTKLVVGFTTVGMGWVLFAGLGSMDGAGAKAFSFFVYSVFYFVIRGAAVTDEARWRILRAFGVSCIIGALLGLWQQQAGSPVFGSASFEITTTGSTRWLPGEFTLYALFGGLVVAIGAIVRRKLSAVSAVMLVAAATELILTQQRSGFVAFVFALLATAGLLTGSTRALRRTLKVMLLLIVVIATAIWLSRGSYLAETLNRLSSISDSEDANTAWRLLSWYEVFDGVVAGPLGHGFAVWDFSFTWDNPLTGSHNSYLDLAYRIGLPGFLLFASMPILLISKTRILVRQTDAMRQLLLVTVCACLLAFLAFASFNVVLETPHMSILFWVCLGLGAGALKNADDR